MVQLRNNFLEQVGTMIDEQSAAITASALASVFTNINNIYGAVTCQDATLSSVNTMLDACFPHPMALLPPIGQSHSVSLLPLHPPWVLQLCLQHLPVVQTHTPMTWIQPHPDPTPSTSVVLLDTKEI